MGLPTATSDSGILDLLRQSGPMSVSQLAMATKVTPTAVRQRLTRLMSGGLVQRACSPQGRGRPSHRYGLTDKGVRAGGHNFVDLALVLWKEVRAISDPEVRRGLLKRLAQHLAGLYKSDADSFPAGSDYTENDLGGGELSDGVIARRMQAVVATFAERGVPFEMSLAENPAPLDPTPKNSDTCDAAGSFKPAATLPVLTALACPYPQLAEQDRGICALERMVFAELLERDVKLSACRLDGDPCCRFQVAAAS